MGLTDAEIDVLDSLALRKAVREAVGGIRIVRVEGLEHVPIDWNEAIAVCERAGMKINLVAQIEELRERYYEVSTPDEACRALLKAIAARDNAKLTAIG